MYRGIIDFSLNRNLIGHVYFDGEEWFTIKTKNCTKIIYRGIIDFSLNPNLIVHVYFNGWILGIKYVKINQRIIIRAIKQYKQ